MFCYKLKEKADFALSQPRLTLPAMRSRTIGRINGPPRQPPFTSSSGNRRMFSSISSVGSSALDSLYGTSSMSSSTGSSSDMSSSSSTTTTSQIANSDGSISIVTKDAQGNIISESTTGSQNASANSDSVDLYA